VRSAVAFLTVLGRSREPGPRTLDWFPVVGALLGLALGGLWWLVDRAWAAPVGAAIVVAADLGLTGMLHLDGVVDSADGLLPPLGRARRLEVMADPSAGAFGVGTAAVLLLMRWAALSAIRPGVLLLAGLWCLSRTLGSAVARLRPYARTGGGLADGLSGPASVAPLLSGIVAAAALAAAWRTGAGLAAVGAGALAAGLVVLLAERRIGGYTGDVLGAGIFVAETAGLVVAAARW
jgi:adenosylcobinamide-GDP ribazoletransferase